MVPIIRLFFHTIPHLSVDKFHTPSIDIRQKTTDFQGITSYSYLAYYLN